MDEELMSVIDEIDELVEVLHPDPNKMGVRVLLEKLQFYILHLSALVEDSKMQEDKVEFMTDLISQLIYLCANKPELIVPVVAVFIEDDWFRNELNEFEHDDVYRIIAADTEEKEE